MSQKERDKSKIIQSVTKMVADKDTVRLFVKGEIDYQTVQEKGIEFAKPL